MLFKNGVSLNWLKTFKCHSPGSETFAPELNLFPVSGEREKKASS